MSPFGYTVLGFGAGKGDVPIEEDLTFSLDELTSSTTSSVAMAMDPFNDGKAIFAWKDDANDGVLFAGTTSDGGANWSLGSEVEIGPVYAQQFSLSFETNILWEITAEE